MLFLPVLQEGFCLFCFLTSSLYPKVCRLKRIKTDNCLAKAEIFLSSKFIYQYMYILALPWIEDHSQKGGFVPESRDSFLFLLRGLLRHLLRGP